MGIAPSEVDQLSLWTFLTVVQKWKTAHGIEDAPAAPTPEEYYAMRERAGPGW